MFLHLSVILFTGGCGGGHDASQEGLCPGVSVYLESLFRGFLSRGCLSGRGSLQGGSLSVRVSVRETPDRDPPSRTVTIGRYASYWNAFL